MAIQQNFPAIRPSLSLDFANTKVLDPRITFTRASEGRYCDGKTVAKAEENLLLRSQEFDNSSWLKGAVAATANSATAPDGTTTADTLTEDANNTNHSIFQSVVVSSSSVVAVSCFAKPASGTRFLTLSIDGSNGAYSSVTFDLSTGAVTQTLEVGYASTVGSSSAAANGYFRCVLVTTTNATAASTVCISLSDASTFVSFSRGRAGYTGDGTSGIYIWGAQLEQRSSVTAYTPTTTQPITNYIPVLQTAAADVARFDHNPTTGESLGLLIEEQRTNLLTYSEQFDNAAWVKGRTAIAATNTVVAPDGTLTAEKLVDSTVEGTHRAYQIISGAAVTTYTFSVYVKAAERTTVGLGITNTVETTRHRVRFELIGTGTGQTDLGSGTFAIQYVGNGWYKCSVTSTTISGDTGVAGFICVTNAVGSFSYTGDGYSGIYIWGAQLEQGSFATSYIPTTASQVTRSADSASMTGTNFSSWYRQDRGTVYYEADTNELTPTTYSNAVTIWDGTGSNRIVLRSISTAIDNAIVTGGTIQAGLNHAATVSSGVPYKLAFAMKVNDIASVVGGSAALTDTSAILPVANSMVIGGEAIAGSLSGHIRKLAFYPERLTNAQLQALTS